MPIDPNPYRKDQKNRELFEDSMLFLVIILITVVFVATAALAWYFSQ